MLAIIVCLFFGMKAVVLAEARRQLHVTLSALRWVCFTLLWPGMRPGIFAAPLRRQKRVAELCISGALRFSIGILLLIAARTMWQLNGAVSVSGFVTFLFIVSALVGISLTIHFGAFSLCVAFWRRVGFPANELFRSPLRSRSLVEFWSRRWNVAYSEMISLAVYRPLRGSYGAVAAHWGAFLFSGVLHELAISVPVRAGYGLPTLYFMLQAAVMQLDDQLSSRPHLSCLLAAFTILLPLPLLFHPPFIRGVVFPLLGS